MKAQFIAALHQICAEKNISEESVLDAVKLAIATAWRKDFGNREHEVEVLFDENSDRPTVLLIKEVVEKIENENFEISLKDAKKIKSDAEVGEEIKIDVTPVEFGRIAAQIAKQVILQKINEAEKDSLFKRFRDRENSLLSGSVNRVEGTYVFLEIDRTNVLLHPSQQIPQEKFFPGKRLKVYLSKVEQTKRGPQLAISRTHKKLINFLMEKEIPEIESGEVKIIAIARDPGLRSKVAVSAEDPKIDPVGACIGQRGARIHPVVDELNGERIDVIEFDADPTKFIARALQPAKIRNVVVVNAEESIDSETNRKIKKRAAVFVDEAERAMAVGKRGQNIRLASELTGFELDMYNFEEYEPFKEKLATLQDSEADSKTEKTETEKNEN